MNADGDNFAQLIVEEFLTKVYTYIKSLNNSSPGNNFSRRRQISGREYIFGKIKKEVVAPLSLEQSEHVLVLP